MKAADKERLD